MSLKKVTLASLILLSLTACSGGSKQGDNHNKVLSDTKLALKNADNKKIELENQLNTVNEEKKALTDNLNALKESKRATEAELTKARSQVEAAQAEKEATKTQLENANNNEKAALEDKLKTANKDLETAKADKESAETKLADKQAVIEAIHHHAFNNLPKKFYSTLGDVDYGTLSIGLHKMPFVFINNISDDPEDNELGTGDWYVYKQTYSRLEATSIKMGTTDDRPHSGSFRVDEIVGTRTETENLPSQGTVTYRGTAFNADNRGNLTYRINFADKTGSGELSNFTHWGNIQLAQGQISDSSIIKSDASMADGTTGKYEVTLFGPNAEEITGEVYMFKQLNEGILSNGSSAKKYDYSSRGTMFGLAGTRGDTE